MFLIEDEYRLAVRRAELAWIETTLGELADGGLSWDTGELLRLKTRYDAG